MLIIAERIKKIMEDEGLNPNSFAVKLGSSDTVIRNILAQKNYPGYELINKILQTFKGIDANWLITGNGKNHIPIEQRLEKLEKQVELLSKNQNMLLSGWKGMTVKEKVGKKT